MSDLERVKQNGLTLQFIKEQTPEICLAAVKNNAFAIHYVEEQTREICLAAVQKRNARALQYIRVQTPEICLTAVQKNGLALEYVTEQTPELCLAAIQQEGKAIQYVKEQTHDLCLVAVKQNGHALEFVKEQTPDICVTAVQRNIYAFNYVNIIFDISPIRSIFDKKICINSLIDGNFIKNLLRFKIDKPDTIKEYLIYNSWNIGELIKLLQEYNYVFSKEQILESVQYRVEIPYVHQYGYNLNSPEFKQQFDKYQFYPESYNLDI